MKRLGTLPWHMALPTTWSNPTMQSMSSTSHQFVRGFYQASQSSPSCRKHSMSFAPHTSIPTYSNIVFCSFYWLHISPLYSNNTQLVYSFLLPLPSHVSVWSLGPFLPQSVPWMWCSIAKSSRYHKGDPLQTALVAKKCYEEYQKELINS